MTLLVIFFHHLFLSLLLTTFTWFIYLKNRNMSIIDMTWALGFFCLILYDYLYLLPLSPYSSNQINYVYPVIILLISIWSIRLSSFIFFTRLKFNHRDTRYENIQTNWTKQSSYNVLLNYWFQGFLQASLSIAFIPLLLTHQNQFLPIIPTLLAIIAVVGESLADYQLLAFKKTSQPNAICQAGLWQFSRHPNYFFDIMFWFSISLYTFLCSENIFVFVSPVLLYIIMRFITGRITETVSLKKKGAAYQAYQNSTPMIFPKLSLKSKS